jgi:ethanolamine permease
MTTEPTIEPRTEPTTGRATHALRGGADAEDVDAGYLAQRQLRSGTAGWVLLAGLGVSAVISGDYAGWNFGLAEGGFGGLLLATVLMAVMYGAMVLGLAELGSALPTAGGGYTFARRALGPWGGYATGIAVLIEYAIAPAAIATFIGAYVESLGLLGITDGWWVYLAVYALFIGVHLLGVGEALKVMLAVAVVAVLGLVVFLAGAVPAFDSANLLDIAPTDAAGRRRSCRTACSGSGRRSPSRSGSSSPSRACRSRRRRPATPPRPCRGASSPRWACSSSSPC